MYTPVERPHPVGASAPVSQDLRERFLRCILLEPLVLQQLHEGLVLVRRKSCTVKKVAKSCKKTLSKTAIFPEIAEIFPYQYLCCHKYCSTNIAVSLLSIWTAKVLGLLLYYWAAMDIYGASMGRLWGHITTIVITQRAKQRTIVITQRAKQRLTKLLADGLAELSHAAATHDAGRADHYLRSTAASSAQPSLDQKSGLCLQRLGK
jgi:hypothetical protein